jgi:putative heme-binding domain-containing protein
VRQSLDALLGHWTGKSFELHDTKKVDPRETYQPWFDWFDAEYPEAAKKMAASSSVDLGALKERLGAIEWSSGEVQRGKIVFEKRACHRCHIGGGKLGPALGGAAARFSRDDLFAHIADPSKDVAPLYQTTQIVTRGGQVYLGIAVYDSAEQVLLQTGPDTTVRIDGGDIATRHPSRQSIMPSGLLNGLTDADLADLYALIKTLGQQ